MRQVFFFDLATSSVAYRDSEKPGFDTYGTIPRALSAEMRRKLGGRPDTDAVKITLEDYLNDRSSASL